MDPYARPNERSVGDRKPRINHVTPGLARETTPGERQAEKLRVAARRRAIKKAARRDLKKQLDAELDEIK